MNKKLQILIVEDNPTDADLLLHQLRRAGFEPDWRRVDTEADYLASLRPDLDLIVSDYSMPQFNALRALALLKGREQDTPFIIVSGTIGEDVAVGAMKMGATDYLLKDRLTRLGPAVNRVLEQSRLSRERQQAEKELLEAERRFREMLENLKLIAMTLDKNGRVMFCNDYLLDLTGWKREEVIGGNWFEKFIPDTAGEIKTTFFENIDAGAMPSHYENPIKTRPGVLRLIRWNNTVLRDAVGNIIGTASIGEDVTARKQAEQALRESEEKFRQIAENIHEVFWIMDPAKNQMLYISPAYETIWGRTCESVYESAQSWLDAIHSDDRERVRQAVMTKQPRGEYDETYRIQRPDGSVRWIRDRAFPIRNAAGEVYRVVGTAEDITEHRNLETQLRQAQKMEAIGQLAAGVAHDFNNLLAVIQGNAELAAMGDSELKVETREFLGQIMAAAERAANLTRQLLAFGRKQVMQPQLIDLNEVVGNMTKMLKRILGEDISLQVSYGSNLPTILGDVGMMEQVVMNLAVNARDAMPRGGQLNLTTSDEEIDADYVQMKPQATVGDYVCLSVSDTGDGIPPELLPRIFEPFFTTKEVGKGTGLGLATVYGIVRQHRGWVTVYSETGRGTVFRMYLPVAEPREREKTRRLAETLVRGGTETLLLAEDDAAVRALMRNVLERYGYKVIEARSGVEALKLWRERQGEIDLVLTDMVMPDGLMSGRELAEQIHAAKPALPVIFMSGYSADLVGRDFQVRDGINFLQKPCSPRKLAQAVRNFLDGESPRAT